MEILRGSPRTFKGVKDTTLRDAAQSPLVAEHISGFSQQQKLDIVRALSTYGVRTIETFSSNVNPAEQEDVLAIREQVNGMPTSIRPKIAAHVRLNEQDIRLALDAKVDALHLYMGAGEHTQRTGHGKNLREMTALIRDIIGGVSKNHPDLDLRYSAEDTFPTPRKNLYTVFDAAVESGAKTLGIPDTTGVARDKSIKSLVRALKRRYPGIDLEGHNHNDYGYAIPNSVTEVQEGVEYMSTSIWGLAERSGIASMTGFLFNLHHIDPEYVKNYLIGSSYELNTMMGDILQLSVPYNEPVSLTNRTHVAGVHTKSTENYEQAALPLFGVTRDRLLLGPLSGWHNIRYYLRELEFMDVTDDQAKVITQEFKSQSRDMNGRKDAEKRLQAIASKYDLPPLPRHDQGKVVYERAGVTAA